MKLIRLKDFEVILLKSILKDKLKAYKKDINCGIEKAIIESEIIEIKSVLKKLI